MRCVLAAILLAGCGPSNDLPWDGEPAIPTGEFSLTAVVSSRRPEFINLRLANGTPDTVEYDPLCFSPLRFDGSDWVRYEPRPLCSPLTATLQPLTAHRYGWPAEELPPGEYRFRIFLRQPTAMESIPTVSNVVVWNGL